MPKLSEDLAQPLRTMQECARRIAKVSLECKLELDEDEYVQVSFILHSLFFVVIWIFWLTLTSLFKFLTILELFLNLQGVDF